MSHTLHPECELTPTSRQEKTDEQMGIQFLFQSIRTEAGDAVMEKLSCD